MYFVIIVFLLIVLPMGSIFADMQYGSHETGLVLIGKWFVFWGALRLLLAGVRQTVQPRFTAEQIFGLKDAPLQIVQELGFANLAMGTLGTASLFLPEWRIAAAVVCGLYYGLAGARHVSAPHKNSLQTFAMLTDFFVSAVLAFVVAANFIPAVASIAQP